MTETPKKTLPKKWTDAEEEKLLALVKEKKSDEEIAEELVISLRTVANHVTSILNKTIASNRTEAAVYATRHGLA